MSSGDRNNFINSKFLNNLHPNVPLNQNEYQDQGHLKQLQQQSFRENNPLNAHDVQNIEMRPTPQHVLTQQSNDNRHRPFPQDLNPESQIYVNTNNYIYNDWVFPVNRSSVRPVANPQRNQHDPSGDSWNESSTNQLGSGNMSQVVPINRPSFLDFPNSQRNQNDPYGWGQSPRNRLVSGQINNNNNNNNINFSSFHHVPVSQRNQNDPYEALLDTQCGPSSLFMQPSSQFPIEQPHPSLSSFEQQQRQSYQPVRVQQRSKSHYPQHDIRQELEGLQRMRDQNQYPFDQNFNCEFKNSTETIKYHHNWESQRFSSDASSHQNQHSNLLYGATTGAYLANRFENPRQSQQGENPHHHVDSRQPAPFVGDVSGVIPHKKEINQSQIHRDKDFEHRTAKQTRLNRPHDHRDHDADDEKNRASHDYTEDEDDDGNSSRSTDYSSTASSRSSRSSTKDTNSSNEENASGSEDDPITPQVTGIFSSQNPIQSNPTCNTLTKRKKPDQAGSPDSCHSPRFQAIKGLTNRLTSAFYNRGRIFSHDDFEEAAKVDKKFLFGFVLIFFMVGFFQNFSSTCTNKQSLEMRRIVKSILLPTSEDSEAKMKTTVPSEFLEVWTEGKYIDCETADPMEMIGFRDADEVIQWKEFTNGYIGKPGFQDIKVFSLGYHTLTSHSRSLGTILYGFNALMNFSITYGLQILYRPFINLYGPLRPVEVKNLKSGYGDDIEIYFQFGRDEYNLLDVMYSDSEWDEVLLPPEENHAVFLTRRYLASNQITKFPKYNRSDSTIFVRRGGTLRNTNFAMTQSWYKQKYLKSRFFKMPQRYFDPNDLNVVIHIPAHNLFRKFSARFKAVPWAYSITRILALIQSSECVLDKKPRIHIYTEEEESFMEFIYVDMEMWVSNITEGIKDYPSSGFRRHYFRHDEPWDVMRHMIQADMLILTKSDIAHFAAYLKDGFSISISKFWGYYGLPDMVEANDNNQGKFDEDMFQQVWRRKCEWIKSKERVINPGSAPKNIEMGEETSMPANE